MGITVAFFFLSKIFSQKPFVEFLTIDSWNCLGGSRNYTYRRQLPVSFIYQVKKCIMKCARKQR